MTRDEIIAMAKEAVSVSATFWPDDFTGLMSVFERFAALVAAAEREACAKVADATFRGKPGQSVNLAVADAIRARGAT